MKMDGIYSRKEFKNFRLKKKQCFAMIHLGARGVKRNNVSDLSDSYTGGNGVFKKKKKKEENKEKGERRFLSVAAIKAARTCSFSRGDNFCAYTPVRDPHMASGGGKNNIAIETFRLARLPPKFRVKYRHCGG